MVSANTHYAVCVANPDGGSSVSGVIRMKQEEGKKTWIRAEF